MIAFFPFQIIIALNNVFTDLNWFRRWTMLPMGLLFPSITTSRTFQAKYYPIIFHFKLISKNKPFINVKKNTRVVFLANATVK